MEKQNIKTTPNQKPSIKKETKSESFNRQKRNMFIIYGISVLLILITIIYRLLVKSDINVLQVPIILNINGWSITHFILYIFLGYFAHSLWYILIIIGFIFEIVELVISNFTVYVTHKIIDDPIINTFGILFGVILYRILPNKVDLYNNILTFFK